jgi:hypothetical protein
VPQTPSTAVILSDGAQRRVEGSPYFAFVVACFVCACLIGCHAGNATYKVHRELLKIAGPTPQDCGTAKTTHENEVASTCALNFVASKTPFIVQYRVFGIDAVLQDGIAMNQDGQLEYVSAFESSAIDSWNKYKSPYVTNCSISLLKKSESDHSLYCR